MYVCVPVFDTMLLMVTLEVFTKSAIFPNTLVISFSNSDVWWDVELAENAAKNDTIALILLSVSSVTWASNNPGMVFEVF